VLLVNLSRDQMDRLGEVRGSEHALCAALVRCPSTVVVANCDDILANSAALGPAFQLGVSPGTTWRGDSAACPVRWSGARGDRPLVVSLRVRAPGIELGVDAVLARAGEPPVRRGPAILVALGRGLTAESRPGRQSRGKTEGSLC
jgi:hypothetical protein